MTIMGIDPSIQSTGICIRTDDNFIYYLIASKPTKKLQSLQHPHFNLIKYDKHDQAGLKSFEKEEVKSHNVEEVASYIGNIIENHRPDYIVMEAVAFQASGTIDQLAGLNYLIRYIAHQKNTKIFVVPPTSIKMQFTGNGQATKDAIINTWKRLDKNAEPLLQYKCDDLADAFAMTYFPIPRETPPESQLF